jgi:hypothetical protein
MEVSLLMTPKTKKTGGMNVCQFLYSLLVTDYRLSLMIGILTCDHEIIVDDVGFVPTSVSAKILN